MAQTNEKIGSSKTIRALAFWHNVTSTALKQMPVDLSARQTAVLLNVYLMPPPHSIKSLADDLMISKPAVCRAIDALEATRLVRRLRDRQDKRNVLIQRTVKGALFVEKLGDFMVSRAQTLPS